MSFLIENFSDPSAYQLTNMGIVGGKLKLLANQVSAAKTKTADFLTTADYLYDVAKVDLSAANAKLKDRLPNATFGAPLTTDLNGTVGAGSLVGTATGGAAVSGGFLVCSGAQYVDWNAASKITDGQVYTLVVPYTPSYSGTPVSYRVIACVHNNDGTNKNLTDLTHYLTTGQLVLTLMDSLANTIVSVNLGVWAPVAGTEYIFTIVRKVSGTSGQGASKVLIDNVQFGATSTAVGASAIPARIRLGSSKDGSLSAAQKYRNVSVYPTALTAQPTITAVPASRYATDNPTVDLVTHSIDDALGISSLDSLAATINGAGGDTAKFSVSQDNGSSFIYHNGSAWVASTTYSQTNTLAEIYAARAGLDLASGKFRLRMWLHSNDGSTTPTADDVVIGYKTLMYRTDGGTCLPNAYAACNALINAIATGLVIPAGCTAKFGLYVNSVVKWWNGTAWDDSDLSNSELNLIADIATNIASALTVNSTVSLFARFTSGDGTTTPELDASSLEFNFGGIEVSAPATCDVFGYVRDRHGNPQQSVEVNTAFEGEEDGEYTEAGSHIIAGGDPVRTDANGYFMVTLIQSALFQGGSRRCKFTFSREESVNVRQINAADILVTVPAAESVDITSLITGVAP
jgi:hypothetical protein